MACEIDIAEDISTDRMHADQRGAISTATDRQEHIECVVVARISQPGGEESLNVAAAAAICLHASATAAKG